MELRHLRYFVAVAEESGLVADVGRLVLRSASYAVVALLTLGMAWGAQAQTLTPVTWNVVGLDSNDVTAGPNVFPVGVRVCNTTATALTGAQARFVWDTTSAYITRTSAATIDLPNLGLAFPGLTPADLSAGSCGGAGTQAVSAEQLLLIDDRKL